MQLEVITTSYDAHQDRLCLDGQSAAGDVVGLWLTYRLLRKLLPMLLRLITPAAETRDQRNILAQWSLAAAQTPPEMEKQVTPLARKSADSHPPLHSRWLISSINLQSSPNRATLVLQISPNKPVATISFGGEHLRQWMAIVYRLWKRAGWPEDQWPVWVRQAQSEATPRPVVMH